MKVLKLALCLSLFSSFTYLYANDHHNVIAKGRILLKNQKNKIIPIKAKLSLPPRGKGPLFLLLRDHKPIKALNYFVERKNGRSIFYIVFPYKTDDEHAIMRGTYTRGTNLALYTGEIFVGPKEKALDMNAKNTSLHDFKFLGNFSFKKRIKKDR